MTVPLELIMVFEFRIPFGRSGSRSFSLTTGFLVEAIFQLVCMPFSSNISFAVVFSKIRRYIEWKRWPGFSRGPGSPHFSDQLIFRSGSLLIRTDLLFLSTLFQMCWAISKKANSTQNASPQCVSRRYRCGSIVFIVLVLFSVPLRIHHFFGKSAKIDWFWSWVRTNAYHIMSYNVFFLNFRAQTDCFRIVFMKVASTFLVSFSYFLFHPGLFSVQVFMFSLLFNF